MPDIVFPLRFLSFENLHTETTHRVRPSATPPLSEYSSSQAAGKPLFVCLSLALCGRVASEKRQLIEPEHVNRGSLHQRSAVPLELCYPGRCNAGGSEVEAIDETARFHGLSPLRHDAVAAGYSCATAKEKFPNWGTPSGYPGIVLTARQSFPRWPERAWLCRGSDDCVGRGRGPGPVETLSALAADLVRSNVNVIVTGGTSA